jgi:hypothetical protein
MYEQSFNSANATNYAWGRWNYRSLRSNELQRNPWNTSFFTNSFYET